ncbi:MAG: hypothetical protein LBR43_01810, partial [Spiroplasmataceae bacterium]|nr:hypothetical protein [Spiroplasmataceae bacterium]
TKIGANGKDYLILELEKGDSIFAFDNYDTPAASWDYLVEGEEYLFTVKEGNRIGSNILTRFKNINFVKLFIE